MLKYVKQMRNLLIILLLTGCVTQKSATKYFDKHPDKGSGYCASKYPVHVGEAKVSEQDWSDTADYEVASTPETTALNFEVSPINSNSLDFEMIKPITRIINHYHKITDSIPYIDSALAHNLRLQLGNALQTNTALQNTMIANNKAANAKYDALAKSKKMWMWIAIAAGAAFFGFRVIWLLIKRVIGIFT